MKEMKPKKIIYLKLFENGFTKVAEKRLYCSYDRTMSLSQIEVDHIRYTHLRISGSY